MEQITCPNCHVDVEREELRQNNLRCPACGFDLSDAQNLEDVEVNEDDDEEKEEEDEDEDEEE